MRAVAARWLPQRARARLTARYVLLLAGVLALYLAVVVVLMFWQMRGVVQHLAIEDIETVEGLLYFNPGGGLNFREDYHTHTQWQQVEPRLLEVLDAAGAVLYRNERLGGRNLGGAPFAGEGEAGYSARTARASDGEKVLLVSRRHSLAGRPLLIRLGYPEMIVWGQWREAVSVLLMALPLALAAIAWAGYKMAGLAFDPIAKITGRAAEINSQRLHERLEGGNADDELGQLAVVINAMLARIEDGFTQLRRFTADAAHELRTPLAALRSVGEVRLQHAATEAEYRDTIGSMLEEIGRLHTLVEGLLTLSRAEAGHLNLHPESVAVLGLAREVAAMLGVLGEDKHLAVTVAGEAEARAVCDRAFLRQALVNVVHNAIKFTPPQGLIAVTVARAEGGAVALKVADNGPGIAVADRERVFDRFHRGGAGAQPGSDNGAGLGLAIAAWAVRAQGGDIGVEDTPGGGCTVWMRLPHGGAGRAISGA